MIIEEIYAADKKEKWHGEKRRLVAQIRMLQVQKISDITTAIGTLYDKRALAQEDSTEGFTFKLSDEVMEYAE